VRPGILVAVTVVIVVVGLLGAGAVLVRQRGQSSAPTPSTTAGTAPAAPTGDVGFRPGIDTAGTDVVVRSSGTDLLVEERAVPDRPAATVLLTQPDPAAVTSSRVQAPRVVDLRVTSDGGPVSLARAAGGWTVRAADGRPLTRLVLSYRLDEAVLAPGASAGRALFVVTPLTADLSRSAGRPVVVRATGVRVRQATCYGAAVTDQLCGSAGPDGWTARVPPSAPVPVAVFQVDLGG
jgi:hypothetical protein